ncbi:MAG TPA: hypothetical protein VGE98_09805, partial [Thermoanaerobaculia bacterium]
MTMRVPRRGSNFGLLFLGCALSASLAPPLQAGAGRWTPIGPNGGRVRVLAAAPGRQGTVYASLDVRLFRTDDAGAHWTELTPPVAAGGIVNDVAVDPRDADTVYLATGNGVLKSTDGGRSWAGPTLAGPVGPLAIAAAVPEVLYAIGTVGSTSQLFKSADAGASWQAASPHFPNGVEIGPVTLSVDPRDAGSVYTGGSVRATPAGPSGQATVHSADGGATWSFVPGLVNNLFTVAFDPVERTTLYAGGSNSAFRSLDGGATWSEVSPVPYLYVTKIAVDRLHPQAVYVAGFDQGPHLWRSDDRGTHWTKLATRDSDYGAFALDGQQPSRLYFGVTASGVDRSDDGGATWQAAGFAAIPVETVAVDAHEPSTLYASGIGGGVVRSRDHGAEWQVQDDGLVVRPTVSLGGGGPLLTPVDVTRFLPDPQSAGTVYLGSDDGVFK